MGVKGDLIAVGVAGAVLIAAAWYAKKKVGEVAKEVLPLVDPTDSRNLANTAANAVFQKATGYKGTIGTALYDYWNPPRENAALELLPGAPYAVGAYQWLANTDSNQVADWQDGVLFRGAFNPASNNNLIYRGVNALGEAVTGSEDWSLGTAIYDWWN